MKKVLLATALLLVAIAGVALSQNYLRTKSLFTFKENTTVTINGHEFQISIADSQNEQEVGLSETKSLSQNEGMIFLFEKPGFYSFWMKNMKFPIDIIFINDNQVVTVRNNAQLVKNGESPTLYTSTEPSDKVLEINAGLAEKYDFKKGDVVEIDL